MELETAARKYLLAQSGITNLVGDRVWKFQLQYRNADDHLAALEGTGLTAIVLRRNGGWSVPIASSAEYPVLVVDCWADHSRNADGTPAKYDREERAMQLYREVDRVLHRPSMAHDEWASEFYTEGCLRVGEPTAPVEDAGVVFVRVRYGVKTFH